jgi:hypothetical protein
MARENPVLVVPFPTTSTGLVQFQAASLSTSGNLIAATTDLSPVGILQEGSTGSTVPPRSLPVMVLGISKLKLDSASTVAVPEIVSASTVGAKTPVAGDFILGMIVEGSSGGANRVVSVLLSGPGGSTAVG